jgi:Secretion system C-terminal sorting domain
MKTNFTVFRKSYLFIVALQLFSSAIFAEGSRELNASTSVDAFRVFLSYTEPAGAAAPGVVGWYRVTDQDYIEAKNSFYVFARAGEKICLASSALGLGGQTTPTFVRRGSIRLYSPFGILVMDTTRPDVATNAGLMPAGVGSKLKENQGPFGLYSGGGGLGYKAIVYTVPIGGDGIYRVEMISPRSDQSSSEYSIPNPGLVPRASADFNQYSNNACISAFDISVMNIQPHVVTGLPDSTLKLGRVYAEYMSLTGGRLERTINVTPAPNKEKYYYTQEYTLKILTYEGYRYDVSVDGMAPYGYFIYPDNVGVQLADGVTPAYESITYQPLAVVNRRVFKPSDPETSFERKHKMFLNEPDNAMPSTALSNNTLAWLYASYVASSYNYTLTYVLNQIPNPMSGWFRFDFPVDGVRYRITVDASNDNIFGNLNDTTLVGVTTTGINYLWWTGLDGNGAIVPSTAPTCLPVKIELLQGEMHIPLADVEMFRGGIQIKRINGGGTLPDYSIHWNDLPLNDNNNINPTYIKKTPQYGVSSASFAHRWEKQESIVNTIIVNATPVPTHTTDYGDNRYIDNWAFDTTNSKIYNGFICFSLLNINFLSFTIHKDQMQWELNNSNVTGNFIVEHSNDGITYKSIGTVTSKANKMGYDFTKSSNFEQGYFRIKLYTGTNTIYSKVMRVKEATSEISLYPNPANDYIIITSKDKGFKKLAIITIDGKIVMQKNIQNNEIIKVKQLPQGSYVAQLTNAHRETQFVKFQILK